MPTIEVNSEKIDLSNQNVKTLRTIIPEISSMLKLDDNLITSVSLNGSEVDFKYDKASLIRPLSSVDCIRITADINLHLDVLNQTDSLLESIIGKITKLNIEDNLLLQAELSTIISSIGIFIQTSAYALKKINQLDRVEADLPVKDLQIHLLSVLKAIETAHSSNDRYMLEDLLEFELKDNLTKWKILVIPRLKVKVKNLF